MAKTMDGKTVGRRGFMKTAAAGTLILGARSALGAAANETLELGIIGCGGRGPWIGDLFQKNTATKVVAVHDPFKDRAEQAGKRLNVPENRQFTGLDGYHELIASGVDAVAIISPPYFHPEQTVAALEAGKHVYLAKPIAVDVPGCTTIVDAANKHQDKLCTLVDFQTRKDPFYIEAIKRLHAGQIGDPVMGQAYYYARRLNIKMEPGTEEARLRNWVFDIALSGDIIVEQNVHMLDVANWMLQSHPLKAHGTGGRKARIDVGDCWDHFVVTYWYPNDVIIDFSSAQFVHAFEDLCTRLHCTTGSLDTHYGGEVVLEGKAEAYRPGATSRIYQEGAVANIKDFHAAIMAGTPINNAEESSRSTLTGVLGRTAAYGEKTVTWDEMMQANEKLDANLKL
jgi:predicted dehydrogenase